MFTSCFSVARVCYVRHVGRSRKQEGRRSRLQKKQDLTPNNLTTDMFLPWTCANHTTKDNIFLFPLSGRIKFRSQDCIPFAFEDEQQCISSSSSYFVLLILLFALSGPWYLSTTTCIRISQPYGYDQKHLFAQCKCMKKQVGHAWNNTRAKQWKETWVGK